MMKWSMKLVVLMIGGLTMVGCGHTGGTTGENHKPTTAHQLGSGGHSAQPYSGFEKREIKALAPERVADLQEGRGAQYALSAELNHYPGPLHVLELAADLKLTPEQEEKVRALVAPHKEKAKRLGSQLVQLERELDQLFASKQPTEADVDRVLGEIGRVEAQLRGEHLKTHLATTHLMTAEQIATYDKLRGYTAN